MLSTASNSKELHVEIQRPDWKGQMTDTDSCDIEIAFSAQRSHTEPVTRCTCELGKEGGMCSCDIFYTKLTTSSLNKHFEYLDDMSSTGQVESDNDQDTA
jgi:hypothetical protein